MSVFLRANNDLNITWELSVIVVLYTAFLTEILDFTLNVCIFCEETTTLTWEDIN